MKHFRIKASKKYLYDDYKYYPQYRKNILCQYRYLRGLDLHTLIGCGCRIKIPFTKEGIIDGFGVSYGKPYPDFESFRKKYWDSLMLM